MANTLNLGTNGNWATKKESLLAYNSENNNFKPLPFNFTRNSSATRINKEGLIETVGSGIPRVDYSNDSNGALLLEPTRTNLVTYSEDIESWSISGLITKENNVATSPNGTLNAGTIITNDASGFHRITQSISVSTNSTYTSSLFIKKVQSQTNFMGIGFIFTGGTTDVGYVIFDAVNGIAVSADARIDVISEVKDFGDYWNLQSTATDNGGNTSLQFNIYATLSTNGTTTGLGISSKRTIWGIQLEQGSYATSYIPTQGSIGTRVEEDIALTLPDDASFNSSNGFSLYGEFLTNGGSGSSSMALQFNANSGYFGFGHNGSGWRARINNGTDNELHNSSASILSVGKLALSFNSSGFNMYANGSSFASGNTDMSAITSADSIVFRDTDEFGSFRIRDLKLYNTRLTDQELINLTKI